MVVLFYGAGTTVKKKKLGHENTEYSCIIF